MSERAFPVTLLLALGVVMYQQVRLGHFPPPPSAFLGVALVFTLLAVLALASPELATALGVAIVLWLVFAYHSALQPAAKGAVPA